MLNVSFTYSTIETTGYFEIIENLLEPCEITVWEFKNEREKSGKLEVACMSIVIVYVLFNIMFDNLF